MKKAIVTGAAGFAGANLVEALIKKNYEVYAVVKPNSSHNERIAGDARIKIVPLDMSEYDKLPTAINEECDSFFHMAWFGDRNNFAIQKNNIEYTLTALKAAKDLGCRIFVGTGSQAEYGVKDSLITEDSVPMPYCSYGSAKLAACYLSKNIK